MNDGIEYVHSRLILKWLKDENPPLNRSASGYGGKIPTQWRVKCRDGRTRRVYAVCYSNAASHFIVVGGTPNYIHDYDFPAN